MPNARDISALLGREFVLTARGLPSRQLFTSPSAWAADTRAAVYSGAWQEWFEGVDAVSSVRVTVLQHTTRSFAEGADPWCTADESREQVGDISRIGRFATAPGITLSCAERLTGRTRTIVELTEPRGDAGRDDSERVLRAVVAAIRVPDSPDEGVDSSFSTARRAILAAWMIGLLIVAAGTTVPTMLFDRSTWERLSRRFRARVRHSDEVDVEPAVRLLTARSWAFGLTKLAALVWIMRLSEREGFGTWETLGLVLACYVVAVLIERGLTRRIMTMTQHKMFRGTARVWVGAGLLGSVLVVLAAALVWSMATPLASGAPVPGMPSWSVTRTGHVGQLAAGLLLLLSVIPLSLGRRLAMRRVQGDSTSRRPVLLLRSFVDQNVRMRSRRLDRSSILDHLAMRRWERFEEVVAAALTKAGTVQTAGTPGERLPPGLGAARLQFTHEEWQQRVAEISERSSFVVMVLGRSESLVWEMRRLYELGHLDKTIFLVPPVARSERKRRLQLLADVFAIPEEARSPLRTTHAVVAVIFPSGPHRPVPIVSSGPDDLSYDVALRRGMALLLEAAPPESPLRRLPDLEWERLDYIPRGQARPPKTWKSNPWIWNGILQVVLLTAVLPYVLGNPFGESEFRQPVYAPEGARFSYLADGTGKGVYGLVEHKFLVEVDFAEGDDVYVGELPFASRLMVTSEEVAYVADVSTDDVAAVDLSDGSVIWRTSMPGHAGAMVTAGSSTYVAIPSTGQVLRLDARSGRVAATVDLGGAVWDVSGNEKGIGAVLADTGELVKLDGLSLEVAEREVVVDGPTEVTAWRGGPVVLSNVEGVLLARPPDEDLVTLNLSRIDTEMDSDGSVLAVSGVERVTLLDLEGNLHRFKTFGQYGEGMRVADGGVAVSEVDRIELLRVFD